MIGGWCFTGANHILGQRYTGYKTVRMPALELVNRPWHSELWNTLVTLLCWLLCAGVGTGLWLFYKMCCIIQDSIFYFSIDGGWTDMMSMHYIEFCSWHAWMQRFLLQDKWSNMVVMHFLEMNSWLSLDQGSLCPINQLFCLSRQTLHRPPPAPMKEHRLSPMQEETLSAPVNEEGSQNVGAGATGGCQPGSLGSTGSTKKPRSRTKVQDVV